MLVHLGLEPNPAAGSPTDTEERFSPPQRRLCSHGSCRPRVCWTGPATRRSESPRSPAFKSFCCSAAVGQRQISPEPSAE